MTYRVLRLAPNKNYARSRTEVGPDDDDIDTSVYVLNPYADDATFTNFTRKVKINNFSNYKLTILRSLKFGSRYTVVRYRVTLVRVRA